MRTTRRDVLRWAAGTAGALITGAGGNLAISAPRERSAEWAFPLLGDLHIDSLEHHRLDWLAKEHPGDVSQVENYSRITREMTPRLFEVVRQHIADAPAAVPFVVQVGDLVEGLCGSEALATRQANDAIDMIGRTGFPCPFLFAKGNHDITGPGAREVYDRVLVPFMEKHASGVRDAAFTQSRDDVLIVFYDAYNRDSLEWFSKLMSEQKPQRLLFVIHPPVVPYNARSTWHIYSSPKQRVERDRLLTLLGEANAVVLCGHLHKYCFLVRRTETGRFSQLALSSVANTPDARLRDLREGLDAYGPELVQLEPQHSPETIDQRLESLRAEQPFITHFEYADTWGHALVTVNEENIGAEIYRGLGRTAWKSLDLTPRQ